jgi:hypothetical protein
MLASAASESLAQRRSSPTPTSVAALQPGARESVESDLTEALDRVLTPEVTSATSGIRRGFDDQMRSSLERVRATCSGSSWPAASTTTRLSDVRAVRRKWAVRLFRLAGHAGMPQTVEFRDALPNGWA